jgi:predicted Zn-dependent protease
MKMLLAARIDPQGMIDFVDVLSEREGIRADSLKYWSTHPIASDRIARLRDLASGWRGTPSRLLPGKDGTKVAKPW